MRAPHRDVAAGDEVAFYLHAHEAVGLVHIAFQNDILIVLLTEGGRDLCTLEFGDAVKVPVSPSTCDDVNLALIALFPSEALIVVDVGSEDDVRMDSRLLDGFVKQILHSRATAMVRVCREDRMMQTHEDSAVVRCLLQFVDKP